jgi:putative flavoprotein involved in K+ transport
VQQVRKQNESFDITTKEGKQYQASSIVVATGSFNRPHLPQIPGQGDYQGEIIHSANYQNPMAYCGKRIIVVGGGNSAVQIAFELAQVAHVSLATRAPVKFRQQRILGRDIHFWLKVTGLDSAPLRKKKVGPSTSFVLDTGIYQAAIQAGKPDNRAMFTAFTPNGVIWSDGSQEQVDAVLFATGYEPNVDFLMALGILGSDGHPQQKAGIADHVGLYFVGLSGQRSFASATLRGVGADAQHVIAHLMNYLRTTSSVER